MSFMKEFGKGISAYGEANTVLFKHGLAKYLLIPGLVTLVYASLYFFAAYKVAQAIPSDPSDYPGWLSWMGSALEWVIKVLFWPAVVALFVFTYKTIAMIVLSPVLSRLSEEVEHRVFQGAPPKTGWQEALSDIQRSILINFRNLFHELFYCFLVSLVPVAGSVLAFGVSSYYTGFNFMDYTMERHRMNLRQSVQFVHKHRGLASGIGMVCMFGMLVPVIGWMVMPTYATIASTLEVYRITGSATGQAAVR